MKGAFEEIAPQPPRTSVQSTPSQKANPDVALMETLAKLKSASTSPPGVQDKNGGETSEKPLSTSSGTAPKRKFTPGPTEAASGMTISQIMSDPVTLGALAEEVARWEEQNPNRKLLGPAMAQIAQNVLPDISGGQATRLAKKIDQERRKMLTPKAETRANRAAASASLGRKV